MPISRLHIYTLLLLLALAGGCTSDNEGASQTDLGVLKVESNLGDGRVSTKELFASESAIALGGAGDEVYIGHAKKIRVHGGKAYIFDHSPPRTIFSFSIDGGRYLGKIQADSEILQRAGNASFEDFSVDSKGYLHILDGSNECLYILNGDFELVRKMKLPGYYSGLEVQPEARSYVLFKNKSAHNFEDSSNFFELTSFDIDSGKIQNHFLPFSIPEGGFTRISPANPLSRSQEAVYYYPVFSDTIWSVREGSIKPAHIVDFGSESLPEEWKSLATNDLIRKVRSEEQKYAFGVSEWFSSEKALGFQYIYGQMPYFCFLDKQKGRGRTGRLLISEKEGTPFPFPSLAHGGRLYAVFDEFQLEKIAAHPDFEQWMDSEIYEDILDRGKTYLVEYRL